MIDAQANGTASCLPAAQLTNTKSSLICPIVGRPCEGDLAYLCEDYGCARKGGLSPYSEKNA